jgi:hypothetical protein
MLKILWRVRERTAMPGCDIGNAFLTGNGATLMFYWLAIFA